MPLFNGEAPAEVHYKVSGGSGGGDSSGSVDLSGYVRRPNSNLDGSWLVYREGGSGRGGIKEWAPVTTDLIATNPDVTFRDAKGRFRSTRDLEELTNQLKVNRFLANEVELLNEAVANLAAGSVVVSDEPPNIEADGQLWYDSNRLELFVSYQDAWISTSPLESRIEAGEALQAEILARVEAGEAKQATIETNAMTRGGAQTLNADNWSIKDDGGNTYAMISDGEITMYHVAYPDAPKQPASKEYADTKIAKKGDTMQGSLAMAGHQITGLGTPKQRGHTVSKGYMDDVIEPILDRLNQLAGSIGDFIYTYDGEQGNAREGKFNAKTQGYELTDLVNETEYVEFSMTDSEGNNPDFARLLDGDILRITGPAGERAEWYVRAGSDGSNGVLLLGDLIRSTFDEFVTGVQYAVTGITVAEPNSATLDPYASNFIMSGFSLAGSGDQIGGEGKFKWVQMGGGGFTGDPQMSFGVCFDIKKYPQFYNDLRLKLDRGTYAGTGICYVWDISSGGLMAKYRINNKGDYDSQGEGSITIYGDQLFARAGGSTTHRYKIELVGVLNDYIEKPWTLFKKRRALLKVAE